MKKTYHIYLIIVILISITACNWKTPLSKAAELKKVAATLSKTCPKTVDFMTTLMKCEYTGPLTLTYTYMVNIDTSLVNINDVAKYITYTKKDELIRNIQKEKSFYELTPTIIYKYITTKGEFLFEFDVTPEMYNNSDKYLKPLSQTELFNLLQQHAAIFNSKQGEYIDEITTIYNCKVVYPKTFVFEYVFPEVDKDDVDANIFSDEIKKELSLSIGKNGESIFTSNDIIYQHNYYDKDTTLISAVEITAADYKNIPSNE